MSDVIDFLEMMGQDSRLRYADAADVAAALASAKLPLVERAALLAGDGKGLETLLDARANVCCIIAPGKEEDDAEDDEEDEADEENEEVGSYSS